MEEEYNWDNIANYTEGVYDATTELFDESKTVIETPEEMRVFDASHPLPEHALEPGSTVAF